MEKFFSVFKRCTIFEGILGDDLKNVLKKLNVYIKRFEKNEIIRPPEVQVTEIGLVLEGVAYTEKIDINGNRIILAELGLGKTFGESLLFTDAANSPIYIIAEQKTTIAFIPIKKYLQNTNPTDPFYIPLLKNLTRQLAQKNMLLQIKNDILSQKTTREKLLLYFEYESKTAKSKTFKIYFSREELADFLSLNTSALSRELGKMRDDGLLSFKKNRFTLKI